jgi:hypothetical protein
VAKGVFHSHEKVVAIAQLHCVVRGPAGTGIMFIAPQIRCSWRRSRG